MKKKPVKKAVKPSVKKAMKSMKPQLEAQTVSLKGETSKVTAQIVGRHVWKFVKEKRSGVELWKCVLCETEHEQLTDELPTRPLEGCKKATARSDVETLPCADCGEELHHGNRSILADGTVKHIGCKRAKRATVYERDRTSNPDPRLAGLPTVDGMKPPKPPPAPTPGKYGDVEPRSDHQGRTVIQLKRDISTVSYVKFDTAGLHMAYMPVATFDAQYKWITNDAGHRYSVKQAVEHYVKYAQDYGATQDVLDCLARVVHIKEEDMAKAKSKLAARGSVATAGGGKATKKAGSKSGAPRGGIGEKIRAMISKGEDTESIVKAVHKEFPGAKTTAQNVSWYRADMRKKGEKVPEPRKAKAAA